MINQQLTFHSDWKSTILQATIINEKNVQDIKIILVFQSDGQLGMAEMNNSWGFFKNKYQIPRVYFGIEISS